MSRYPRPITGKQPASFGSAVHHDHQSMSRSNNASEVVQVPFELSDFAADSQFNEILLNVKKQTNINHIERQMDNNSICTGIIISSSSNDSALNARKLVETHFKNRIKMQSMEARLAKTQGELFSAQGEMASGMMIDFTIPLDMVGLIIGKGGERIRNIQADTNVKSINVNGDTGKIIVVGPDAQSVSYCISINDLVAALPGLKTRGGFYSFLLLALLI